MSKQTDSNLLIVSSVPALYQHLLRGVASYKELGNRILRKIKTAYSFRQVEQVRELARMLALLPTRDLGASRGIAAAKSTEGFHASALRDLERLIPFLRHVEPITYSEVMSSYAVELLATNRLSEALDVALIAVSSPFGLFYSEWQETLSEVKQKRKHSSTVTVPPERECGNAGPEPESEPQEMLLDPRVQSVIEFMHNNLQQTIPLPELAAIAYLSPSRFSHLFKTQTGVSPGEYFIRLKMERAAHLLTTTLISIKEIMALVGYDTRSNFVGQFRKYFDCAPSEYRKRALLRNRRFSKTPFIKVA
jgi:AraC-like DNA-binding protein